MVAKLEIARLESQNKEALKPTLTEAQEKS